MDETDLINIKWHGSTTGNLRGGQIQEDLDEYGIVEQLPKLEGKQMVMVYAPKK